MAARKRGSGGRTTQPNASPGPTAELADTAPEPDTDAAEASAEPDPAPAPVEPVRKHQIERRPPMRAGGHVLTERGWELDQAAER